MFGLSVQLPAYKTYGRCEVHDARVSALYYLLLVSLVVTLGFNTLVRGAWARRRPTS